MLAEQHDEWQVSRRYMSLESLKKIDARSNDKDVGLDKAGEEVRELTAIS